MLFSIFAPPPPPRVVSSPLDAPVFMQPDQGDLIITAPISVTGGQLAVNLTNGAGGLVDVRADITAATGIVNVGDTRYDITVAQGATIDTRSSSTGIGIYATQDAVTITNRGTLLGQSSAPAQTSGVSAFGTIGLTFVNHGIVEARYAVQLTGSMNSSNVSEANQITNYGTMVGATSLASSSRNVIVNNGTINPDRDFAFILSGNSPQNMFVNNGRITGGGLSTLSSQSGTSFVNGTTGVIESSSRSGISLSGTDSTVENRGLVTSEGQPAIFLSGERATLTNTGTVKTTGIEEAVVINGPAGTLVNQGRIEGDAILAGINGILTNTGTIAGGVLARTGTTVDTSGGTIEGAIDVEGYTTVLGGGGGETLRPNRGWHVFEGGAGEDAVTFDHYTETTDAVSVDLAVSEAQKTGLNTLVLAGIENATGTAGQDVLLGSQAANKLRGLGGADMMRGRGGADSIEGGAGNDILSGDGGDDALAGGSNFDVLRGGAGNDLLTGGAGDDVLDGGSGSDTAVFSGNRSDYAVGTDDDGQTTVTDNRSDGDGTDTLVDIRFLRFADQTVTLVNAAPGGLALSTSSVAENALVNTIVASLSAVDADGDAITYRLVSDAEGTFRLDGNQLLLAKALDFETQNRERTVTVEASDPYGGTTRASFTLAVTNVIETAALTLTGTGSANRLEGEAGNDVILGLSGNDTLLGGAGNDRLDGGLGLDALTGGAGQDVFLFNVRPAKTTAANKRSNLDTITDFSAADDTIWLAKSAFAKIGKAGVLAKGAFQLGAVAREKDDRILYDKKTGALLYDADGAGGQAAVQIATLAKNLKGLSHTDFFVV